MIIALHVSIALTSIVIATIGLFRPANKVLYSSYAFIIATVTSGAYLLVAIPSHILQSCFTGLSYLMIISMVTIATHVRLRRIEHSL